MEDERRERSGELLTQFRTLAVEKIKARLTDFDSNALQSVVGNNLQGLAEAAVDDWLEIMNEIGYEPRVKDMEA